MRSLKWLLVFQGLLLGAWACAERCPVWGPDGKVIPRNLMLHLQHAHRKAWAALADGEGGRAYQALTEMAALLEAMPAEGEAERAFVQQSLKKVKKALAALRLGDLFAARDALRGVSTGCMGCHGLRRAGPSPRRVASP